MKREKTFTQKQTDLCVNARVCATLARRLVGTRSLTLVYMEVAGLVRLESNRPTLLPQTIEPFRLKSPCDSTTTGAFGKAVNRRICPVHHINARPGRILPLSGFKFLPFQEKALPGRSWGKLPAVVRYSAIHREYVFADSGRCSD